MTSIFGSHSSQKSESNTNQSSSSTTTPNVPKWLLDRWDDTNKALDTNGMTDDQREVADWLMSNMQDSSAKDTAVDAAGMGTDALAAANASGSAALNKATGAGDAAVSAIGGFTGGIGGNANTINDAVSYLKNQQNNGSNTLGHWFAGKDPSVTAGTSANPGAVDAGTGAAFMGNYNTALNDDYINASLADYDEGAARGFNALRANSASAFGNKRTGIAEGTFQGDAARGRASLSSGLRLNAFNTAAGLGQSDATRKLAADSTNAGNLLSNNQFNAGQSQAASLANANLLDSRQKFDIGQADAGDNRRIGVANDIVGAANAGAGVNTAGVNAATAGAGVASNNFNNAMNYGNSGVTNATNVGNSGVSNVINANDSALRAALASGNFQNMTVQQLLALMQSGTAGIGSTTNSSGTSNTKTTGSGTTIGAGASFKIPGM